MGQVREDDFNLRRGHLEKLSEEELEARFWKLSEEILAPIIGLARTQTTPSIERSVLLRMGFSSIEAKAIVNKVIEHGLMGKGAGHVVYRCSKLKGYGIREAGLALMEDNTLWGDVISSFKEGLQ